MSEYETTAAMRIDDRAVTVPFNGGWFSAHVPSPVANEIDRLHAVIKEQMDARGRALDRCDRLLDKLEHIEASRQ